jgi:ribosome biogenesis SPOUT family RNA methylase Rps3
MADRTAELRQKGYEGRRLGPVQMTTDTAVRVTRMVVQDKSTTVYPDRVMRRTIMHLDQLTTR